MGATSTSESAFQAAHLVMSVKTQGIIGNLLFLLLFFVCFVLGLQSNTSLQSPMITEPWA